MASPTKRDGVAGAAGGESSKPEATTARTLDGTSSSDASDDDLLRIVAAKVSQRLFAGPKPTPRIARFTVLDEIGRGGMGTVYAAYDPQLDRKVAVKVLREDDLPDEEDRRRFLREARALARLSHPHVVTVHETGDASGELFLAMEFVHGQNLAQWLSDDPGWRAALQAFIQAGEGLMAVHHAGLVHRDLKPHNIMRREDGVVKLLDFGLARAAGEPVAPPAGVAVELAVVSGGDTAPSPSLSSSLTRPGTVMGTPAYMSLEQLAGEVVDARSDQFSFCVALYEALYGERPFRGDTMSALVAAMTAAEVRAAPKDRHPVPQRLRAVLVRGLAADPGARWPSMDALLEQLRLAQAPPRWRRWGTGAVVALGLVGFGLAVRADADPRCTGARARLDGVWDDDRREAAETAILGTELSYAPGTWVLVESRLDAYSEAWVGKHTEICEATAVRREQSDATMQLRMRCLAEHRTSLRASVDVLTEADADVVQNATKLVASLPRLASCDDSASLEQQAQRMPPPEDPAVAAEVEAEREHLADIGAMTKAGRYDQGLEEVESLVHRAQELGYPPLVAEALGSRGLLQEKVGRYAEAEQDFRRAHALAVEHSHEEIAFETAEELGYLVGNLLERHAEGQQWIEMSALPLARRSGDPAEVAGSQRLLSNLYFSRGEYEEARALCQQALEIFEKVRDADHPRVGSTLGCLGNASLRLGKFEDAREYYERALRIAELRHGRDHPKVAGTLSNLGIVYDRLGRYEDALSCLERALTIRTDAQGPDHPDVASILNGMGNAYSSQQKYEESQPYYERALAIRRKALDPSHPRVATSLHNLGSLLVLQGKNEEAKPYYEQSLAIQERVLGPEHPDLAMVLSNLGNVYENQGDYDTAQRYLERALKIQEKALGPEHLDVATTLNVLGDVCRGRGQYAEAQGWYERALKVREKELGPLHPDVADSSIRLAKSALGLGRRSAAQSHAERAVSILEAEGRPEWLAEARFVSARALWRERPDRAVALAEQARGVLAGSASGEGLAEIEAWLAEHRAR